MRIPLEWLKEYVDVKGPVAEVAESFTLLGLMLDKPVYEYKEGRYSWPILDLEHRMDRSDWLSILGCARDYAAFEGLSFKMPPVHAEPGLAPKQEQIVDIKVECPDVVKRFNTKVFRNIKVVESPDWLKNRLKAYGIPAINNIVDITNYVMVEYGQPMHAQDLAKMEAQEIVIRRAKEGEEVTTLLGETVKLTPEQFVLTQAGKATVIGGIVGGNTTGVDKNTKDIVLDAGNYDQNNIRRSSRSLKILNETVLRYDKYLHPELAQHAMERAVYLILELAGGDYYENVDWYPQPVARGKISLRMSRLEKVGGVKIENNRITEILTALEYRIIKEDGGVFELEIPYFRTDIEVEDDVAADILRINNYNAIPLRLMNMAPPKEITPEIYTFEEKLKDLLASGGLHEHITDPILPYEEGNTMQVRLENALTADKSALRTNMRSTLWPVLKNYEKHKLTDINIFEVGKTYEVNGAKNKYTSYKEIRRLQVLHKNTTSTPYENTEHTKKILSSLLQGLGIEDHRLEKTDGTTDIFIHDEKAGSLEVYGFMLLTEILLKHAKPAQRVVSDLPQYSTQNLSLIMDVQKPFGPVFEEIKNFDDNIVEVEVEEEYTGKELAEDKKAVLVKITYKTNQTEKFRAKLLKHLKSKFKLEHRD